MFYFEFFILKVIVKIIFISSSYLLFYIVSSILNDPWCDNELILFILTIY